MKVTIVKEDNAVHVDNEPLNLDLSGVNFPANFWALQWNGSSGHIEYTSATLQNDEITSLPDWANTCVTKWQTKKAEIVAAEAAAAEIEAQTP